MRTLMKAYLASSLLSLSVSSFAIDGPWLNQQMTTADFSEKKQRTSSLNQLVSFMQDLNKNAGSNSHNSRLNVQSIYQNSLNHKKLPEKLVAGR